MKNNILKNGFFLTSIICSIILILWIVIDLFLLQMNSIDLEITHSYIEKHELIRDVNWLLIDFFKYFSILFLFLFFLTYLLKKQWDIKWLVFAIILIILGFFYAKFFSVPKFI